MYRRENICKQLALQWEKKYKFAAVSAVLLLPLSTYLCIQEFIACESDFAMYHLNAQLFARLGDVWYQ